MSKQAPAREPIRALIADDEYLGREAVRLGLETESDFQVVGEARNGAETVALIRTLEPDVVFLDIQMPQGGGFDVVEQIGVDEMPITIFVTAYDDQALRAFGVHAMDYVVKPMRVSLRDLMQQLDPGHFRRVHRSTILNIDRVREVQPWFGGDYVVILQDGRQLRVSRTFAPDLLRPLQ